MQGAEPAYRVKYVGDRGRRSTASSVIPEAQPLICQTLLGALVRDAAGSGSELLASPSSIGVC